MAVYYSILQRFGEVPDKESEYPLEYDFVVIPGVAPHLIFDFTDNSLGRVLVGFPREAVEGRVSKIEPILGQELICPIG